MAIRNKNVSNGVTVIYLDNFFYIIELTNAVDM